ncbi:cytochrome P450 20A1-like [Lingula anatina]|uniref:Cytochrome P450 20A1-like n=1 Tax=Lingula anatina TaxID=7574 RepID=A0A1S3ILU0_LINAN|nr:cytochrome P450 20A1-like [Lingula anatina]|eukprot:XP_013399187.1 cytochrome P450 20A1-like [Lingula anatina]
MLDFVIFAITFFLALLGAVIYLYPGSRKVTSIPGLDPSDPNDGNLADIAKAGSLHEFLVELHETHGPIASFWMGQKMVVSTASPGLFSQQSNVFDRPAELYEVYKPLFGAPSILFTNGGAGRKRREMYDGSMRNEQLLKMSPIFSKLAEELAAKWGTMVDDQHIPLTQHMLALSFKGILRTLFPGSFKDDKDVVSLRKNLDVCWHEMEQEVLTGEVPEKGSQKEKRFTDAKTALHTAFQQVVSESKDKTVHGPASFLSTAAMHSDSQALSDSITYLGIGFQTTGNLLSWLIYFLATHQDVQQKVYDEIKSTLGETGKINPSNISKMEYLHQVIDESLRCAGLITWVARQQDFDTELAGHKIVKNTPVIQALGVVLQDENLWPVPNKFDPDRFSADAKADLPLFCFEPFGFAGRRRCPGFKYTYIEICSVVAVLLQKFTVHMVEGIVATPIYGLVTHPEDEVWVTVSKRK